MDEFVLLSHSDLSKFVQKLTHEEEVPLWAIEMLQEKIKSGELNLTTLYTICINDHSYNNLSKIVRGNWIKCPFVSQQS